MADGLEGKMVDASMLTSKLFYNDVDGELADDGTALKRAAKFVIKIKLSQKLHPPPRLSLNLV